MTTPLVKAEAPTKPYKLARMASFNKLPEKLANYDIEVEDVHEFYAEGINVKNCMGSYHPHGDLSIHEALVNMCTGAPLPLIHGQGNFGGFNDKAAAGRYIEAKLNKTAEQLFMDKRYMKVVPMLPNYDGKELEPAWLPAKLPTILATGVTGIAVGVTTNMPAYTIKSLREVCLAIIAGEKNTKKLSNMLEFSTFYGGKVVSSKEERHELFINGDASKIVWANDYKMYDDKLVISGLNPVVNFEKMWESIANNKEMQGDIADMLSMSQGENINLIVKFKRGAKTLAATQKKLEDMMHNNNVHRCNVLHRSVKNVDGLPDVDAGFTSMSPYKIILEWLKWRLQLERDAATQEIVDLEATINRENLLLLACRNRGVLFEILNKKGVDIKSALAKRLKITEEDSATIWQFATGRLSRLSEAEQLAKIAECEKRIKVLNKHIKSPTSPVIADIEALKL